MAMWLNRPIQWAGALAAVFAASACATAPQKPTAITPTQQFSPQIDTTPERLAIAVHSQGLSSNQTAALADFAGRWRDGGAGPILLQAPDGPGADEALTTTSLIRSALEHYGVPPTAIRQDHYVPQAPGQSPVLASFEHTGISVSDCSTQWNNLTSTLNNNVSKNFGCSVTSNIALQVADPRDLVAPPPLAAGDNVRREVVLGNYRAGKVTSSEKDTQASGAVSTAVQQ